MAKQQITIELEGSPFEIAAQKAAIDAFVKMPKADRDTIIAYTKLEIGHRERLSQIIQNNKALAALKSNWLLLKIKFA